MKNKKTSLTKKILSIAGSLMAVSVVLLTTACQSSELELIEKQYTDGYNPFTHDSSQKKVTPQELTQYMPEGSSDKFSFTTNYEYIYGRGDNKEELKYYTSKTDYYFDSEKMAFYAETNGEGEFPSTKGLIDFPYSSQVYCYYENGILNYKAHFKGGGSFSREVKKMGFKSNEFTREMKIECDEEYYLRLTNGKTVYRQTIELPLEDTNTTHDGGSVLTDKYNCYLNENNGSFSIDRNYIQYNSEKMFENNYPSTIAFNQISVESGQIVCDRYAQYSNTSKEIVLGLASTQKQSRTMNKNIKKPAVSSEVYSTKIHPNFWMNPMDALSGLTSYLERK